MNRSNLYKGTTSHKKHAKDPFTPRVSAALIIKSAKMTLQELELDNTFQKPLLPPKNSIQSSITSPFNINKNPELLEPKQIFRARSALDGCLASHENRLFSNDSEDENKKRTSFDTLSDREKLGRLTPSDNGSTSKSKNYIIRRRKPWSSEFRRIPSVSTPSRGTTRESETGTEKKEEDCSERYFNDLMESIDEEEKIDIQYNDSGCGKGLYNNIDEQLKILGIDQLAKSITQSILEECKQEKKNQDLVICKKEKQVDFDVKLGDLIGEGAYGQVYQALNIETGQFIAVKHMVIGDLSDNLISGVETLCQEIVVYQKLDHPNIVKYLGAKQEHEDVYIYMEFMTGGSLSSMLKQYGSFEEKLIKKFTKQVVLGLNYLHSNGIIHRDIKGANIMSDSSGNVKLADFGAAKNIENYSLVNSANNSEVCNSIKGSLFWMAPELIKQEHHGFKIDIWSLGCTVIEMATACHPWPNVKSLPELVIAVMTQKCPPIPNHLSECAKDFIRQCCQFDKKLRPRAKDLLKHPFLN